MIVKKNQQQCRKRSSNIENVKNYYCKYEIKYMNEINKSKKLIWQNIIRNMENKNP